MKSNYFWDKNSEYVTIEKFIFSDTSGCLILYGEYGAGKSTLLHEAFSSHVNRPDIRVVRKVITDKPIVVSLLELADVICAGLGNKEFYYSFNFAVYGNGTHYLTSPLSGDTSAEARVVFEGSIDKTTLQLVELFCEELIKSIKNVNVPLLVLLDFQELPLSENWSLFIDLLSDLKVSKHKIIIALREDDYRLLKTEKSNSLHVRVFNHDQCGFLLGNSLITDNLLVEIIWKQVNGDPLKYYLASIIANKQPSILKNSDKYFEYVLNLESETCKKAIAILRYFSLALEISTLSEFLGVGIIELKKEIVASNLLVWDEFSATEQSCYVIHPSICRIVEGIKIIDDALVKRLLKFFSPKLPFFDTYGYYAKNPGYLFSRLDILQDFDSEVFVDLLTSAPIRMLMRQWMATEHSKRYLLAAINAIPRSGSNTDRAQVYRDLAYYSKMAGEDKDYQFYYEKFIEELSVIKEDDTASYVDSVLQVVEGIIEKSNFCRQEGNYGKSIDLLFEAQSKLDFLLELSPKNKIVAEGELARIIHNLGIVYRDQAMEEESSDDSSYDKAISCFEEALEIEELHSNIPGILAALSQLATLNSLIGKYNIAGKYFKELQIQGRKINEDIIVADTAGNISSIYSETTSRELWQQALAYANIAVTIYRQKKVLGPRKKAEEIVKLLSRKLGYGREN